MKKIFFLFIFLGCICNLSRAQQVTFERYYDYGFAEAANAMQQTTDGGYIIFGRQGIAIGVSKILLLKTDSFGIEQWHKLIGKNNADNYAYSGQQTSDGGYIMTGNTTGIVPSDYDVYLVKTDSNGDTLWSKQYGTSGPNMYDNGWCVKQTSDGGYIIACQGPVAAWIIKTDSNGDSLWTKTFLPSGSNGSDLYSIQQTLDTGYIVTGTANFSGTSNDIYLIKTDSLGDTLWTRTWGGAAWDRGQSVQQTSDTGYIVVGYTYSFGVGSYDVYLIKTDLNGDSLWTKTYGDVNENTGWSVRQTTDGGYIIGGTTSIPTPLNYDVWLIKTNSAGDTLWTKKFGDNAGDQYAGYDGCVKQTSDGGYVICGLTAMGNAAAYVVKTDSSGNIIAAIPELNAPETFSVFPNPFCNSVSVNIPIEYLLYQNLNLTLCDMLGREIKSIKNIRAEKINLDLSNTDAGIYLVCIRSESRLITSQKIIKQ